MLLPPPPVPRCHRTGDIGHPVGTRRRRGQGGWRCGRGDPGDRLDLEGSLEPADSGSIILRGMQFPQQQRVRGQRGEPAAPLGIAILPPLPNAAGRGVGARCRGAVSGRGAGSAQGRRRRGGRGRGGGRAGAAGEAAEAQCGVVSKDVTNCLQEQQTLVNPWAAGCGSAGGAGGTPVTVPPLPPPRSGRATAPRSPRVAAGTPARPACSSFVPAARGTWASRSTEANAAPGPPSRVTSTPARLHPPLFSSTGPTGTPGGHTGVRRATQHPPRGHHAAHATPHTSPTRLRPLGQGHMAPG